MNRLHQPNRWFYYLRVTFRFKTKIDDTALLEDYLQRVEKEHAAVLYGREFLNGIARGDVWIALTPL